MRFCDSCDEEVTKDCEEWHISNRHEVLEISSIQKEKEDVDEKSNLEEIFHFAKQNILELVISQDDGNTVYAKIKINDHIEPLNVDSEIAINWLMYHHRKKSNRIHAYDSYKNALKHIKSEALFDGSRKEKPYIRIAQTEKGIYYDLCQSDWSIVRITSQNYVVLPYSKSFPIFDRRRGLAEQLFPNDVDKVTHTEPLDEMCDMFGIAGEDRIIFKTQIIHFFLQSQESPIMVIIGEHGSRKTTLMNAIKKIVDPSNSNTGSLSLRKEEIPNTLSNKYLCAFDNVSGFNHEISDILCRAITGDEISRRALYTNNDMYVMSYQRKIIINGIYPSIEFPDFNDRAIYYDLKTIKDSSKIAKSEFWEKFDALIPFLLDQIFRTISKMLATHEKIGKNIRPHSRLADFEKFGETISQSLGYNENEFLESYRNKCKSASLMSIDSWSVVKPVLDFMKSQSDLYESYLVDFYKIITEYAQNSCGVNTFSRGSNWPQKPQFLTSQINRLRPQFRQFGLTIEIGPYTKRDRRYEHGLSVISIKKSEKSPLPALPSNPNQSVLELGISSNDIDSVADTCTSLYDVEQNQKLSGNDGRDGKDQNHKLIRCTTCNTDFKTSKSLGVVILEHNFAKDQQHQLEYVNEEHRSGAFFDNISSETVQGEQKQS